MHDIFSCFSFIGEVLYCVYFFIHLANAFKVGRWEKNSKAFLLDDLNVLHDSLQCFVKHSKAENTFKQYNCYFKLFGFKCNCFYLYPYPR